MIDQGSSTTKQHRLPEHQPGQSACTCPNTSGETIKHRADAGVPFADLTTIVTEKRTRKTLEAMTDAPTRQSASMLSP